VDGLNDRNDEDELTKLLLDNMFNDLEPSSYGMN
jgi:hypothetical protein